VVGLEAAIQYECRVGFSKPKQRLCGRAKAMAKDWLMLASLPMSCEVGRQ